MKKNHPIIYRISQLVGFLIGARFSSTALLTFALYVSTFFLFNHEESLKNFVFDFKVHGIIFCAVLSILAGGIINQFYDQEKDRVIKPFRSRLQSFLKQKYFLYAYLGLNLISLTAAFLISERVFIYFLLYQFLMWFYSHRLSRILILNNITFVLLTLYPFFGMLVYYQTFSLKILVMAVFLFLILFCIDILKDILTKTADNIFGYNTIATHFGLRKTTRLVSLNLILLVVTSGLLVIKMGLNDIMAYYFLLSCGVFAYAVFYIFTLDKRRYFIIINGLRLWVFIGIIAMLVNGILIKF